MPEEKANIVSTVADAVKGVAEAVPIYNDAVQPLAQELGQSAKPAGQELGKALVTVSKAVNVALLPISGLVWSYEQIRDFVNTNVGKKLEGVPLDEIQTPAPNIAVPALQALTYTGHQGDLRELYSTLLASSIDVRTASIAHPAFVEMIKQITPDEAKLMRLFSKEEGQFPIVHLKMKRRDGSQGYRDEVRNVSVLVLEAKCEHPQLGSSYLNNLTRLGLIEIPDGTHYTNDSVYASIFQNEEVKKWIEDTDALEHFMSDVEKSLARLTNLGKNFISACILDHQVARRA